MSSRTVKWLLLASVLLIAFPVVAGASTARVAGLGIQGDYIKDYTNVYTYLSNISFVGNVVYGELGNLYGSTTSDRGVGAILGNLFDGRYGTLGIRMSEETAQLGQGDANTPVGAGFGAWDPNVNTSHAFDILWGKKFGKASLGLQMNRSYSHAVGDPFIVDFVGSGYSWKEIEGDDFSAGAPEDLNYHRNILGFGGGIGLEVSPTFTLEASMLYQSRTFSAVDTLYDQTTFSYTVFPGGGSPGYDNDVIPGQKWENDGSGAYLMALRGLYQAKPDLLLVPMFKYYSQKADVKGTFIVPSGFGTHTGVGPDLQYDFYPAGSDSLFGGESISLTDEDQRSCWQVGLAGNWTLNQNDLFVIGATVASNQHTVKSMDVVQTGDIPRTTTPPLTSSYVYSEPFVNFSGKFTETLMPSIFAALETHVNSWLTLRLGATQGVFYSVKHEFEDFEYNYLTDKVEAVRGSKNVTTYHYSPFTMELGAGFKLGTLQLDATVNPAFVHNGPYLISGASTGGMFPRVTATYTF